MTKMDFFKSIFWSKWVDLYRERLYFGSFGIFVKIFAKNWIILEVLEASRPETLLKRSKKAPKTPERRRGSGIMIPKCLKLKQ